MSTSAPAATFEGTIFTACIVTNILALTTAQATANNSLADYKIIPISRIQSFQLLSPPPAGEQSPSSVSAAFEYARPQIGRVDIKALQDREAAAIRKAREKDALRGKGVSKEGQDIFDALFRT